MSDTARLPPVLLGLFRELLANGVPLGVRDYLDALRALQLGFGQDGRQALRDLVLALWSRSDAEHRLITRWFDLVPVPTPALVDAIDEALAKVQAYEADQSVGKRQGGAGSAGEKLAAPAMPNDRPPPDAASVEAHARVSFVGTHARRQRPAGAAPVGPAGDRRGLRSASAHAGQPARDGGSLAALAPQHAPWRTPRTRPDGDDS